MARTRIPRRRRLGHFLGHFAVTFLIVGAVLAFSTTVTLLLYRVVDPPHTPLMVLRGIADARGRPVEQRWVPLEEISPHLVRAVIASEDTRFCRHVGFDLRELLRVLRRLDETETPRGASTITNQTAKNLFLLPQRAYVRKALEVPLSVGLEIFWPKRRILEVYLNIVEWGHGVYGAEAAARHHFGIPAARLSRRQAAYLAVSLPNPRLRHAGRPTRWMRRLADRVLRRMRSMRVDPSLPCPWHW